MSPKIDRRNNSIKRNLLISAAALAVLFIITGCTPPPPPDIESPGARMYIEKCSSCHPVRHPKMFRYKRWVKFVDQMEKKVKSSGIREPLTDEEREIILRYLKKHSQM
jgi:hypothetical protein